MPGHLLNAAEVRYRFLKYRLMNIWSKYSEFLTLKYGLCPIGGTAEANCILGYPAIPSPRKRTSDTHLIEWSEQVHIGFLSKVRTSTFIEE